MILDKSFSGSFAFSFFFLQKIWKKAQKFRLTAFEIWYKRQSFASSFCFVASRGSYFFPYSFSFRGCREDLDCYSHSSNPSISTTSAEQYGAKLSTISLCLPCLHEISGISPDFIVLWDYLPSDVSDTICANVTFSRLQIRSVHIVDTFVVCEISSIFPPLQATPLLF